MTGWHRFDPDRALDSHVEYRDWRAARWPANAQSWRVRRWFARRIEAFASGFDLVAAPLLLVARLVRNFADFVHGQPQVRIALNWGTLPARSPNKFVKRTHVFTRDPDSSADVAFLIEQSERDPAILDHVGAETRATVERCKEALLRGLE